jgi:hypothetical protein
VAVNNNQNQHQSTGSCTDCSSGGGYSNTAQNTGVRPSQTGFGGVQSPFNPGNNAGTLSSNSGLKSPFGGMQNGQGPTSGGGTQNNQGQSSSGGQGAFNTMKIGNSQSLNGGQGPFNTMQNSLVLSNKRSSTSSVNPNRWALITHTITI